ncbi:glycyl-radical enzyme activating protein [Vagococcus sp.]|uniref:glycyl-radical enzyme activating protein n=1 Tax=Vagococcus sp. TaxID=1933889 RepID=UPI003F9E1715
MKKVDYENQACVFNIQRFSIHDGPGIRTIVFIKGCPLKCKWCFNPESQNPLPTEHFGQLMTVQEVFNEIKKDQGTYRRSGGGITFSGGEALTQPDFLENLCLACQLGGLTTAIETTGFASKEVIQRIIPLIDHVLLDIKAISDDVHIEGTGVSNRKILENALLINELAQDIVVRIPVVPGFNYDEKQIQDICDFTKKLTKVKTIHLLPYTNFGENKYKLLNREYELADVKPLHKEDLLHLQEIVINNGFNCLIGG